LLAAGAVLLSAAAVLLSAIIAFGMLTV